MNSNNNKKATRALFYYCQSVIIDVITLELVGRFPVVSQERCPYGRPLAPRSSGKKAVFARWVKPSS